MVLPKMNLIQTLVAFCFPVYVASELVQSEMCMERLARLEKMVEVYQEKMTVLERKVELQGQTILHLERKMAESQMTNENDILKQNHEPEKQGTVTTKSTSGSDTQGPNLDMWNLTSATNKRYSKQAAIKKSVTQTVPAFYAHLSHYELSPGSHHTVIFDAVETNSMGGYNKYTGIFTVPESGLYIFSWTTVCGPRSVLHMEIIHNAAVLGITQCDTLGLEDNDTVSSTVVALMNAGDVAFIRTSSKHGSIGHIISNDYCFSSFSASELVQSEMCMERLARLEKMVEVYQEKMIVLERKVELQGQTILHLESKMAESQMTSENEILKQNHENEKQDTVTTKSFSGNDTQGPNLNMWNLTSATNKRYSKPTAIKKSVTQTVPAFYAHLSHHELSPGSHHTVIFDAVETNSMNGYNKYTGIFTAPESGVYAFSWTTVCEPRSILHMEIIHNAAVLGITQCDTRGFDVNDIVSSTVVALMNAGDVAFIRTSSKHGSSGHIVSNDYHYSSFCGWLL